MTDTIAEAGSPSSQAPWRSKDTPNFTLWALLPAVTAGGLQTALP